MAPARPLLVLLGLLTLPAAAFVSPAASATKKMAPLCAQNKDSPERDPITARAAFDALSADATTDSLLRGLRERAEEMRRAERDEARREEMRATALDHAWVVLFRGDESGDGIHSLSSNGREIVLAFEAADEARRFALVLRAQGFFEPTPHRMDMSALELFCESDERVSLLQIPKGTCIVPPDETVDDVEFTPSAAAAAAAADGEGGVLTDAQLAEARQRLELLFR